MNGNSVTQHVVLFEEAGQRLDNFLFRMAKGVPKTHIYRIIRSGGRCQPKNPRRGRFTTPANQGFRGQTCR